MTKHVCKILRLNSKRLLRKLQKNVRGLLYFAAPCTGDYVRAVEITPVVYSQPTAQGQNWTMFDQFIAGCRVSVLDQG